MATGDLTTLADVKSALNLTATSSDTIIGSLITSASRAIQTRYQREFYPVGTATRTFECVSGRVDLAPYDLLSTNATTGLSLYPETASPLAMTRYTDFDLKPVGATLLGTYTSIAISDFLVVTGQSLFRFGSSNLNITGIWGPATIPVDVARACILTVAAWLDRGADTIAGFDSTVRPDGTVMSTSWAIPTAAHRLLQPYERMSYA